MPVALAIAGFAQRMGAGALLAFRAIAVIAHVGFVADVSPGVVFKGNAFAARDFGRCQAVEVVVVEALVQRLVPAVVVTVQQVAQCLRTRLSLDRTPGIG